MQNILRFFYRYRMGIALVILQLVGIGMTAAQSQWHHSKFWSTRLSAQAAWIANVNGWKWYFNLADDMELLALENAELKSHPADSSQTGEEPTEWIPGRLVFGQTNLPHNHMLFNKGSLDGVKAGQGVISTQGVVGVVTRVSDHYARIMPIIDADSRISAASMASGHFGTVRWVGRNAQRATWEHVGIQAPLQIGDTVVSDGRSAIFPNNWPIGIIDKVMVDSSQMTQYAYIALLHDFSRLQPAYVVNMPQQDERQNLSQP